MVQRLCAILLATCTVSVCPPLEIVVRNVTEVRSHCNSINYRDWHNIARNVTEVGSHCNSITLAHNNCRARHTIARNVAPCDLYMNAVYLNSRCTILNGTTNIINIIWQIKMVNCDWSL